MIKFVYSYGYFQENENIQLFHRSNCATLLLIKGMSCTPIKDPVRGIANCSSGHNYGSICTTKCDSGYERESEETSRCEQTGDWSKSLPACEGTLYVLIGSLVMTFRKRLCLMIFVCLIKTMNGSPQYTTWFHIICVKS